MGCKLQTIEVIYAKKVPDLNIGDRFGDWIVLEEIAGKREKRYLCRCNVFKAKPRNGERIYKGTGKAPYYFIVTYNGNRYQKWGYESAEAAYQAKCQFIDEHFKGLVKP